MSIYKISSGLSIDFEIIPFESALLLVVSHYKEPIERVQIECVDFDLASFSLLPEFSTVEKRLLNQ